MKESRQHFQSINVDIGIRIIQDGPIREITVEKIAKAFRALKNGKASGLRNVDDELLKSARTLSFSLLKKPFNS